MSDSKQTGHSYPVYKAHERNGGYAIEQSRTFLIGDPWFRSKKTRLIPTNHDISFRMYSADDKLTLELEFERLPGTSEQHGTIALYFDPRNSRRRRHNAFVFYIRPDGGLEYELCEYEIYKADIPDWVEYQYKETEDASNAQVRLSLPLSRLKVLSDDQRVFGFNCVRTLQQEGQEPQFITWSGITGDRPQAGHGTGEVLLTKGLTTLEIEQWEARIASESDTYFLKWEKWELPSELYVYVKEKTQGCSIRLDQNDLQQARENAERSEWGRLLKQRILKVADYWADKSDHELFDFVPVGNPRALSVGQFHGDPYTGGKRTAYQVCLERPYQFYCPATKEWVFNGKIMINPTTGEEHVLDDDGRGFVAPEGFPNPGARYMYTASYRLFLLGMLMGKPYCSVLEDREVCPETSGSDYAGAIPNLAYAYQLTGNKDYAYKALLLIGRIAELIPYMNGDYGSDYYDTTQISEPTTTETHWLSNFFEAADLLFETMSELQPKLSVFFQEKPDAEGRQRPSQSSFSVAKAIQEMIPYILYSAEIEKTRTADWSMRWIYLELKIASYMGSGKLMQHILFEGKYSLQSKIRNNFFRDGRYIYDSVFYVEHNCSQLATLPNNTYRFCDDDYFPEGINLFADQRFGLDQVIKLYGKIRCGSLIAMFGDNNFANNQEPISEDRKKGKFSYDPAFEISFRRLPAIREAIGPVLAQYEQEELQQYRLQAAEEGNLRHGLLLLATAPDWQEYQQYKTDRIEQIQPSALLQDSETSILRAGTDPHNCKHVMLYGQPSAGHRHGDKLGLWVGAYGYHLLAGAGAYPFTWISEKWQAWEVHSAACTVVVIDGQDQQMSYSRQKCHLEGDMLQLAGMENTTANPGSHLERWCALVTAPNGSDAYVLDLNFAKGGETFDYNTLGLDIDFSQVEFSGVKDQDWLQMEGTLAGADVPLYSQPGYGWMKALRKADQMDTVTWNYNYPSAGLKVHALADPLKKREVICCLGERGGQEQGKSRWEPFVLWRDTQPDASQDQHVASFISVLEPHETEPFLQTVQPLRLLSMQDESNVAESADFQPAGVEIDYHQAEMKNFRDVLIFTYNNERVQFADSSGKTYTSDAKMVLFRYRDEQLFAIKAIGYSYISDGSITRKRPFFAYRGTLEHVDIQHSQITINLDSSDELLLEAANGQAAMIDAPEYLKPSTYYLLEPKLQGNRLTFASDMNLIKLETDVQAPHKRLGLGDKQVINHEGKEVYIDLKAGDRFTLWNKWSEAFQNHESR